MRKKKPTEAVKTADSMNLIDIPFCLLSHRNNSNIKCFRDTWTVDGKDFYYEVWAHEKYGMPTFSAEGLYLALMKISYDKQFCEPTVECTAYEILDVLGWGKSKKDYQRLMKNFCQLAGASINTNYMWDPFTGKRFQVEKMMHIIDEFSFNILGQQELFRKTNYFTWGKTYFETIKLGYVKQLDFNIYKSINLPIAKRLYRYIDKQLKAQNEHRIGLEPLCYRKLNMTKARYISQLKDRLKPAIDELNHRKLGFYIDIKPGMNGDVVYFHKIKNP